MNHLAIEKFERAQMRTDVPKFRPGDTIRVNFRIQEGERERLQAFEGVCIRRNGGGSSETITVRKISSGIGVERTFFLHSPLVESIKVQRHGHVRRARLYYLRSRFGKKARVRGSKKFLTQRALAAAVTPGLEPEPPLEEIEESAEQPAPEETQAGDADAAEETASEQVEEPIAEETAQEEKSVPEASEEEEKS